MLDIETLKEKSFKNVILIPVGGCGEFGMNMTLLIAKGKLFVIDCGLMFPPPEKLGVDAIIPDIFPIFSKFEKVEAYIITHGHEDHIGALPYIWKEFSAPIYASPWTLNLITRRFSSNGIRSFESFKVDLRKSYTFSVSKNDSLKVRYYHVNHSIPNACLVSFKVMGRHFVHSGDFKIHKESTFEAAADLPSFKALGDEGVDLLLCDSTNAHSEGFCPREEDIFEPLSNIVASSKNQVILTTFASNLWRLKTFYKLAKKHDRKVVICGTGLENALSIAAEEELVDDLKSEDFISDFEANKLPRHKRLVIATGSQGEERAALKRISIGEHKNIKLAADDTVVFSSRIIPGNEKAVYQIKNDCLEKGVKVIDSKNDKFLIHCSGHAYKEDVLTLCHLLRPKAFAAIHGSYAHQLSNQLNAVSSIKNSFIPQDGSVISILENGEALLENQELPISIKYIDSESKIVIEPQLLRERLKIGELGAAFVTGIIDTQRGGWHEEPTIYLKGLPLPEGFNEETLAGEAKAAITQEIAFFLRSGACSMESLNEACRLALRRFLSSLLVKKPVVVAHIYVL